jgi:putative MATE family efflux protein
MLVNGAYNFVDRLFIGNIEAVGALAIAGVGISMPILTIVMAFSIMIASGAATNISLELGRGNNESASRLAGNAISLSIAIGILLTAAYYLFKTKLLSIFGASDNSISFAEEYMNAISIGIIPWILSMNFSFIMRVYGSPIYSAIISAVGALLNIPLDYLFIFKLDMDIFGAGLASTLAFIISTLMYLHFFIGKKIVLLKFLRLNFATIRMIVAVGITPFVIQFAFSFAQAVTNNALSIYGGDLAIGAMTTIGTVITLFFMPLFGLCQGMQPIVGFNFGAGKFKRAKNAFILTSLSGTAILTLAFLVTMFIPAPLILIFNKDPELFKMTLDGMRKVNILLPTVALTIVGTNYILSIGNPKLAMVLSLLRQMVVLVPALILLPRFFELNGVWFAQPLGDIVSFIAVLAALRYTFMAQMK